MGPGAPGMGPGGNPGMMNQQQMQQEKFGTVALPLYAVVNSDGNALTTFPGLTRDQTEFVSFLRTGQAKFAPLTISMNREDASRSLGLR